MTYLEQLLLQYKNLANKVYQSEDGYKNVKVLEGDYDPQKPLAFNVKASKKTLNVFVDGVIDGWFMDVTALTREITNSTQKNIVVHINSVGGDVVPALSIYSALRNRAIQGADITAINEGVVASAAMLPFLGADNRYSGEGLSMVHNVMSVAIVPFSNDAEFDEIAVQAKATRTKIENQMIEIYRNRLGKNEADIRSELNSETFMDSTEMVSHGYATEAGFPTEGSQTVTNMAGAKFDLIASANRSKRS